MKENSFGKSVGEKMIIFIINPFIAFILSLFDVDKRSSRVIMYLWFILFGLMFIPLWEITGDSYQYYEKFIQFNPKDFQWVIRDYFSGESNYKDLYEWFTFWLVKLFTDNYHVLFALWATVFGFFYIKAVGCLVKYFNRDLYWISFFLVLLFMLSNPIYNINGIRFWTAAWMGVYGAIKILKENKYIYLLLVASTLLVHGGFSIFIIVLLLSVLVRKQLNVLSIVYIISFFLSVVSITSLIEPYLSGLPLFFSNFVENYAEENVVADKMMRFEELPFYARLFRKTPSYYINIMALLLLYCNKKKTINLSKNYIYVFALVILVMCNLLDEAVPSVSGRYLRIAEAFIVFSWMINLKELKQYNWFIYSFPIFYWYRLLYLYRDVMGVSDVVLYIAPAPFSIIRNLIM